jgi:hypothetical protein
MDLPIKAPDECIRRKKPNRPRQKPIHNTCQEAVAEEEDAGYEPLDMQSSGVVPDTIDKHPDGTASTHDEALPPPMVVLKWISPSRPHIQCIC